MNFIKSIIILWLFASLFVDSVPPATDGSKWGARVKTFFLRLIAPVGLIRTAIERLKNIIDNVKPKSK